MWSWWSIHACVRSECTIPLHSDRLSNLYSATHWFWQWSWAFRSIVYAISCLLRHRFGNIARIFFLDRTVSSNKPCGSFHLCAQRHRDLKHWLHSWCWLLASCQKTQLQISCRADLSATRSSKVCYHSVSSWAALQNHGQTPHLEVLPQKTCEDTTHWCV